MAVFQNGGQNFKGRQLQDFKKGSKREHGNFVHPPFEISGSAPDFPTMQFDQNKGFFLTLDIYICRQINLHR